MKFYAVKVGRQVGVYDTWEDCKKQIDGYKGAQYKSFPTMEQALVFIRNKTSTLIKPPVRATSHLGSTQYLTTQFKYDDLVIPVKDKNITYMLHFPIINVLYVDGGQNKITGTEAWGCVVDGCGIDMIATYPSLLTDMHLKDVSLPVGNRKVIVSHFQDTIHQNNGAELMALIAGLRIAIVTFNTLNIKTIFSDSELCVKYWSVKLGSSQRLTFDPRKVSYIENLIELRRLFENNGGSIVKINGNDNLADLGYH